MVIHTTSTRMDTKSVHRAAFWEQCCGAYMVMSTMTAKAVIRDRPAMSVVIIPLLGRILAVPPTLPDEYKKRVEPEAKCLRGTTHVFIRSLNGSLTETTPAKPT